MPMLFSLYSLSAWWLLHSIATTTTTATTMMSTKTMKNILRHRLSTERSKQSNQQEVNVKSLKSLIGFESNRTERSYARQCECFDNEKKKESLPYKMGMYRSLIFWANKWFASLLYYMPKCLVHRSVAVVLAVVACNFSFFQLDFLYFLLLFAHRSNVWYAAEPSYVPNKSKAGIIVTV